MGGLWVEEYRPKTVDEVILPKNLKKVFKDIVKSGDIPNLILPGGPGTGKTTIAYAICRELGIDEPLFINGSDERNIDTLRNKIRRYASTMSLDGSQRVVIIDEADYLNPQSTQPALRGFMEEFHDNCRFILTCNFKNKIIQPLHSRCAVHDFIITKKDLPELAAGFFDRLKMILKEHDVEYDDQALVTLITRHAPDWRRVLNMCQSYAKSGKIDSGILADTSAENFALLVKGLREKDFKSIRKWAVENADLDPAAIYRALYDNMVPKLEGSSAAQVILTLSEYQFKSAFAVDQEINLVACCLELIRDELAWK